MDTLLPLDLLLAGIVNRGLVSLDYFQGIQIDLLPKHISFPPRLSLLIVGII